MIRFAAVLATMALSFGQTRAVAAPPNILIVLSDDHSWAHVGCYGNAEIKTPNLDAFAKEGMRFDRYYVGTPQCVPSRATMLTGRGAIDIQMTRFSAPLPRNIPIYPEHLRKAGYYTGVAGRNFHLDGSALPPESKAVFDRDKLKTFPDRLDSVTVAGNRVAILGQYNEFLDSAKGKPFFLQLCFSDPHRPLDKAAIPAPHDPAKLTLPKHYPDTKLIREDFARYYDEISRFDADFATVLAELKKRGLAENTIVLFAGDNGASQFRGKGTLYEFGIHCPLLVRWPAAAKPGISAELISGEDFAPTMLEAAGVPVPKEITGKSFLPLLTGKQHEARKYVFAQRGAHGSGLPTNSSFFDLGRCVVSKSHKLVYNALWQIPYNPVDFAGDDMWKELKEINAAGKLSPEFAKLYFSQTRPMFELFDLANDPSELANLIGKPEAAAVEKDLKAALQDWMIGQRDFVPLPVPPDQKKKAKD